MHTTNSVTTENRIPNRWLIAAAGVVIELQLGTLYAWSVFKKPFMENHGWSGATVNLAFTLAVFFSGLGSAAGGRFIDRFGPRRVAVFASLVFGVGTFCTGFADRLASPWLLYGSYGVLAGFGNGLCYLTMITLLVRWFPDRRGFITGVTVMGFGLGGAIAGQLAPLLIERAGIANTFFIAGAAFVVMQLAAVSVLNDPPQGWAPPGGLAQTRTGVDAAAPAVTLRRALRMPQYYLLWCMLCINVTAGLSLLSNLSPIAQEQLRLSAVAAGSVILAGSVFNGAGRLFWAWVSDRIGRRTVYLALFLTVIPAYLLLPHAGRPLLFTALCCYMLFCYGGGLATLPALVADTFGSRHLGAIYGSILLGWSTGGVLGPMLMEFVKTRTGSFAPGLLICAALLACGALLTGFYRSPGRGQADESAGS